MTKLIAWAQRLDAVDIPQPPGNSLALIDAAYGLGFDGVELDLRVTKDNQLVLMHDSTIDRRVEGEGKVAELTLGELQTMKLRDPFSEHNEPQYVPSFAAALAANRDRGKIMVDLRAGVQGFELLASTADEVGFNQSEFLLLAYSAKDGELMKKILPRATVLLKAPSTLRPPKLSLEFIRQAVFSRLDGVIAPTANYLAFTERMRKETQNAGLMFGTYLSQHAHGPEHLKQLFDWELDFITSAAPRHFKMVREALSDQRVVKPFGRQDLFPELGYFGGVRNNQLVIDVGREITGVRLQLEDTLPNFLNLRGIRLVGDSGAIEVPPKLSRTSLSSMRPVDKEKSKDPRDLLEQQSVHSAREVAPMWELELDDQLYVAEVRIANRMDGHGSRSHSLAVSVRSDTGSWERVYAGQSAEHLELVIQRIMSVIGPEKFPVASSFTTQEIVEAREYLMNAMLEVFAGNSGNEYKRDELNAFISLLPHQAREISDVEWRFLAHLLVFQHILDPRVSQNLKSFSLLLNSKPRLHRLKQELDSVTGRLGIIPLMVSRHGLHQESKLSRAKQAYLSHASDVIFKLQMLGYEAAICYGTLLGAERNNRLIPHDDDLDIIFSAHSQTNESLEMEVADVAAALQEVGFALGGTTKALNRHIYSEHGVSIDLFPVVRFGDEVSMYMQKMQRRPVPADVVFPFKLGLLEDQLFPVLAQPEEFLALRYGDSWKEADPFFEWAWRLRDTD